MPASTAEPRRVVVRADASPDIGLGHVMRSLTLAGELARGSWSVTCCGAGVPLDRAAREGVDVAEVAVGEHETMLALDPDLVVVDGYHFGSGLFDGLERAGVRYAVIDDDGETPARRPALVLNQNPHATADLYAHLDGDPRLLLGTEYTMVRPEVAAAAAGPSRDRSTSVLVAFGGSDTRDLTVPVAKALVDAGLDVRVAIGAAHADRASAVDALRRETGLDPIEPAAYVEELATARLAVLAAGSSIWEAACLGTPVVAVVVAENQRAPAGAAHAQQLVDAVVVADDDPAATIERIAELAASERFVAVAAGHRLGSGGARRVAVELTDLVAGPVVLRPATPDDATLLFELRTDPDVDGRSFGPAPTRDEHDAWLRSTLEDRRRRLFVAEDRSGPIGQVRLDAVGDDHEVSVALLVAHRGSGRGARVLDAAIRATDTDVVARIRPGNSRSLALFSRAGFACESSTDDEIVLRHRRVGRPTGSRRS